MPQVLKKPVEFRGRGFDRIDWKAIADGRQYRLVAGEDFDSTRESVQSSAHQAAGRLRMRAQTMRDGDDVIVQFFKLDV